MKKALENGNNLKKHNGNLTSPIRMFKCDKCKKEFNREWKMHAHDKIHRKYQCEKSFEYQDIKKKHVQISH